MFKLFPDGRTFLNLGGLTIQWYAIFIVSGAIIAYIIAKKQLLKRNFSEIFIDDLFVYCLLVGIVGARLWYVLFSNLGYYLSNPIEIIMITNGGLAIHGGLVFGIIFGYFYAKKYNYSFYTLVNVISPTLLLAQGVGRWGNFMNQEAYGSIVNRSFLESLLIPNFIIDKMYINGNYHHPTFLYEFIGCLLGVAIIYLVINKLEKLKTLTIFGFYLFWYGLIRYFIESLRTDSLMIGSIKMAQLTSIGFIIIGLYLIFIFDEKKIKLKKSTFLLMYDLDGTLLDTTELIYESFKHVFNKYKETPFLLEEAKLLYKPDLELTDELLKSFLGPSLKITFERFFEKELINELIEEYRKHNKENHINYVKAFDNVKEYLQRKKEEGYINVVITTKMRDTAIFGMEITNIIESVDYVVGLEEVTNPKPDPEGINHVLDYYKATSALYVGDNSTDILAAKAANVCSVGVAWGPKGKEEVTDADYIIEKIEDLDQIISTLEG